MRLVSETCQWDLSVGLVSGTCQWDLSVRLVSAGQWLKWRWNAGNAVPGPKIFKVKRSGALTTSVPSVPGPGP